MASLRAAFVVAIMCMVVVSAPMAEAKDNLMWDNGDSFSKSDAPRLNNNPAPHPTGKCSRNYICREFQKFRNRIGF